MTPEEMIKKLDELRREHMEHAWKINSKIVNLIDELGLISTCVWGPPQSGRINAPAPRWEEHEVFQYCIAHGAEHRRAIAWLGDRTPDDKIPLLEPGTRRHFATILREPVGTLEARTLYAWNCVFNAQEGA